MAKTRFEAGDLRSFLQKEKIARLSDLKRALGASGTMTVFRKLKALGYLSSYSHRGQYYTLREIPHFDEQGLWSHHSVWFSQYGNLVETVKELVEEAEAGWTSGELQGIVHVECKGPLRKLYQAGRLERRKIAGRYVYLAAEPGRRSRQVLLRQEREAEPELGVGLQEEVLSHELKAAIVLFFSLLDEKQRRLYAGLEAHKLGHGGDQKVAEWLGLNVHTVARGRRELFGGEVDRERVRKAGGGRKPAEKKRPKS